MLRKNTLQTKHTFGIILSCVKLFGGAINNGS